MKLFLKIFAFNVVVIAFMAIMWMISTEEAPFSNWNFVWGPTLGTIAAVAAYGVLARKK